MFNASHNRITFLPHGLFKNALEITEIDLSYNQLTVIETKYHFDGPLSLISFHGNRDCENKMIHVNRNNSSRGMFMKSQFEHELYCTERSFGNLWYFKPGRNTFDNVIEILECFSQSLLILDLSGCFIGKFNTKQIKSSLNRFRYLSELHLSDTKLTEFDLNILHMHNNLMVLDLSKNNLKSLRNVNVLRKLNLEELNLAGNQLENAWEVIQYLGSSVQCFGLSNNVVGNLNSTVFKRFMNLKALNLRFATI